MLVSGVEGIESIQAEYGDKFPGVGLRREVQVQQMRCPAPQVTIKVSPSYAPSEITRHWSE
jgi:hypothetical protein